MESTNTRSAGGVVIGEGGTIALIMSQHSRSWLFPKGTIEAGESEEQAARREIAEEAGLTDLEYIDDLGSFMRPPIDREGLRIRGKEITMYLFAAQKHAQLAPTMEIIDAKWVPYREVADILGTPRAEWFAADRAWFASVFPRVREAIQRD